MDNTVPAASPIDIPVRRWAPIETAPQDGSWILGFIEGGDVRRIRSDVYYIRCWATGEYCQSMNREPVTVRPTHWMPMPEAPNAMYTAKPAV